MNSHYHVVFALCVCLAASLPLSCCSQSNQEHGNQVQSNLQRDDLPFSPCITGQRIGALPDSYILEEWPLPEPVKRFYRFLDEWRKLPTPQGYTIEDARRDMRDTLTDEQCMLALKGLYGALDPGSVAFHSFLETGRQELDQYPREPAWYYSALWYVAEEKLGHSPLFMLAFADGIYEIEVTHVTTDTWFTGGRWVELENRDPNVSVVAEVVDTIKGAWLLTKRQKDTGDAGGVTKRSAVFTYNKSWATYDDGGSVDNQRSRPSYGDIHHPKPGDRYLVFMELHVGPADSAGSSAYSVNPMRDMQYEGGLFEIRDGKVHDSSNYFGLGTSPDIDAVKAKLRSIIAEKLLP